jgi:hypothetical protein
MDGSMVFIRKQAWKEAKLARIFTDNELSDFQRAGPQIQRPTLESDYALHLGGYEDFLKKVDNRLKERGLYGEYNTDNESIIAIADGARWIWQRSVMLLWDEYYPKAIQILDYYHLVEKIGNWSKKAFVCQKEQADWMKWFEGELLEEGIGEIIEDIKERSCGKEAQIEKEKLLTYLENNKNRIDYKSYREKGYLIGSGSIESANKCLVQSRLKRGGQRWTEEGLRQVGNLRVARFSNRWNLVHQAILAA